MKNINFENYGIGMNKQGVCLSEHDLRWIKCFEEIKAQISDPDLQLHHIGSTSIPGAVAKPVLDIMGVCTDEKNRDSFKNSLEKLGFEWKGEYGIAGRRFAVLYDQNQKRSLVHLHIFPRSHKAVFEHFAFRDYMIQNSAELSKYNALKVSLEKQFGEDRQKYTTAKSEYINSIVRKICANAGIIELIGCDKSHAGILHKWRLESNLLAFNPIESLTKSELEEKLPQVPVSETDIYANQYLRWMVKYNDLMVGTVTIKAMSPMMKYAEVGYGIGQDYQGLGLGYLAVKEMVTKVFRDTDLKRLFALVHSDNIASCRVLEKIGFMKEGVLRDHYIVGGKAVDEVFYGLLKREYHG